MSTTTTSNGIIDLLLKFFAGIQTSLALAQAGIVLLFSLFGLTVTAIEAKIILVVISLFLFWRYVGKVTNWIGYILIVVLGVLLLGIVTV